MSNSRMAQQARSAPIVLRSEAARWQREAGEIRRRVRGPSVGGALDAALKLQESVGTPAFGYSTAEYLHGPIAAVSPEDRVVLFSGSDEPTDSTLAVTTALLARGVPFVCLGSDQTPNAQLPLPLPDARWARTAVLAYVAQLTCAELAAHYGVDPDQHPSLRKVTATR